MECVSQLFFFVDNVSVRDSSLCQDLPGAWGLEGGGERHPRNVGTARNPGISPLSYKYTPSS